MADVPNGPVPVPKIDLEAILGLLKTSGWKDKRLLALLLYPVLVLANNKWVLGLTEGQLEYFGLGLAAYIVTSGGKAAVLGMQFLKWFQHGSVPEVVSAPPAEKKRKSGVVGAVVSGLLLAVVLVATLLPSPASAQQRATLADSFAPKKVLLDGAAPPLTSVLAPAYLLGVGAHKGASWEFSPSAMLGGTLALGNLLKRPVCLFAGGGVLASDLFSQGVEPTAKLAGTLGLTWALTSGGQNETAGGVYGSYAPGGSWAFGLAVVVSNLSVVGGG